ncbi:MAG: Unknown protein [uncultured Campylobacterales bacterium]|uniref:OmpA-like domain-containing protein n=1 Tax=uncultured Campylobacterales bacterium TaxID=352960 RepID=A0A6S6T979_9BACT|nr:MAG: Unknown protein [uncultured Campylobacterales bacterium]
MKFNKTLIFLSLFSAFCFASSQTLFFDYKLSALDNKSFEKLDSIATEILSSGENVKVLIYAHANDTGSIEYNKRLSERRADAIKNELILRSVPLEVMHMFSMGELYPIENDKEMNKRALIRIINDDITKDNIAQPNYTTIFFEQDTELGSDDLKAIENFANSIDKKSKYKVMLLSHTDSDGASGYNKIISIERAKLVDKKLKELGVENIVMKSYGEDYPVICNDHKDLKKLNRRIELKLIK